MDMRDDKVRRLLGADVPNVQQTSAGKLSHVQINDPQQGPLLFPNVAVFMMHDQAVGHIAAVASALTAKTIFSALKQIGRISEEEFNTLFPPNVRPKEGTEGIEGEPCAYVFKNGAICGFAEPQHPLQGGSLEAQHKFVPADLPCGRPECGVLRSHHTNTQEYPDGHDWEPPN